MLWHFLPSTLVGERKKMLSSHLKSGRRRLPFSSSNPINWSWNHSGKKRKKKAYKGEIGWSDWWQPRKQALLKGNWDNIGVKARMCTHFAQIRCWSWWENRLNHIKYCQKDCLKRWYDSPRDEDDGLIWPEAKGKIKNSQLEDRRLNAYVTGSLLRCGQWDEFQRDP